MNKIFPMVLIGVLILSSFVGAVSTHKDVREIRETFSFSEPVTSDTTTSNYLNIDLKATDAKLMFPGEPLLPKIVKVYDLPFASTNVQIECIVTQTSEMSLVGQIAPAPTPVPLLDDITVSSTFGSTEKDEAVYASSALYPTNWYDYRLTSGLNANDVEVTHAILDLYPVRYSPAKNLVMYANTMTVKITYEPPQNPLKFGDSYDMVIIAPKIFSAALQPLIDHKNSYGVRTTLMTTQEIYKQYDGVDKPEKIKYFIKDAKEKYGIKYVMLVGGLRSYIFAIDRENANEGTRAWQVPVRYTNLYEQYNPNKPPSADNVFDPGYISDLYYADIYDHSGEFSSWDTNYDGVFAVWGKSGVPRDANIDLDPDVYVGRLACRNTAEVKAVVDKIIRYETTSSAEWLKKIIAIAGDGFQDQNDLAIEWDVKSLPTGKYTIYAKSNNSEGVFGPLDVINVTVDRSVPSSITFVEDDNLKTKTYPAKPIAEITSPSEGNVLGSSTVNFIPPTAYLGDRWARVEYVNGIMKIRGKSYDPQPHGFSTTIHVWIKDSTGQEVLNVSKPSLVYFEGELETWKGLQDLPSDFVKQILWSSNGNLTNQADVITAMNEGSGFVYFAGHGNPRVWANHFPGIPGGRANASIIGLANFDFAKLPFFPMRTLTNKEKLPVLVVGGCHNSQFNVTLIKTLNLSKKFGFLGGSDVAGYWTHGVPLTECWSWALVRQNGGGAIATIGCTGLGYGILGVLATSGLGGWIDSEFFKLIGENMSEGNPLILGNIHGQTIANYIHTFPVNAEKEDCKTVQEWELLGDPSLRIGGYPS